MTPAETAATARMRLQLAQDVARGLLSAADVEAAMAAPMVLAGAPTKAPPTREPGDEDEDVVATGEGLTEVRLFTATDRGPVAMSAQEQKRAIARALADIRDADGSPVVFLAAGGLVRVGENEKGTATIVPVDDGVGVRILVDQYLLCGWPKPGKDGASVVWSNEFPNVQSRLIELSRPVAWSAVGVRLKPLETVRSFPFFDKRRRLVNRRGYHEETRCYLDRETAITPPRAGESPVSVLREWLVDFEERTFCNSWDFTYTIAALLTILMRPGIDGPVPLLAVMAAMPGTGKGKLVSAVCLAAMGENAVTLPLSADADRQKSEVLSVLRQGKPVASIDNSRQDGDGDTFGGEAIESVITADEYGGRLLGTNTHVTYPNRLALILTANNPRFTRDMIRRTLPITLGTKEEKAEGRSGWKRPDIDRKEGWTMRHRARIIGAIVAMVEEWRLRFDAGERWNIWAPGSFEAWAEAVGGVCVASGLPGWGGGIDGFYEACEPEDAAYKAWAVAVCDLMLARGTWRLNGADMTATLESVQYFRDQHAGSTERISAKKGWEIARKARGRVWQLPARMINNGDGTESRRSGGMLRLEDINNYAGQQTAHFRWSET